MRDNGVFLACCKAVNESPYRLILAESEIKRFENSMKAHPPCPHKQIHMR